jgi:regulator of cell morphogenesis and NO signaling
MQQKFTSNEKMNDLIHEDHSLLLVISRFGLSLGFGDKTVKEVCDTSGVDCNTFLAVVNFLSEDYFEMEKANEDISIPLIIDYLKNAHKYFLYFKFPTIRKKLLDAISEPEQNIPYSALFIKFFDEYVQEVEKHIEYEDKVVFKYANNLIHSQVDPKYSISIFRSKHNEIDSKLEELKNILIKYYPAKENNYLLTEVLFDILLCEKDLASHNRVEDFLFVPTIEAIEQKYRTAK